MMFRTKLPVVFTIMCATLSTACHVENKRDAVVRSDSSGVELVSSTGTYRPLTWGFDTLFMIGAPGDSAFKRVREHTVQVSRDGHIYLLDTGNGRIYIHDQTGKLTASIPPGANGHLDTPSALVLQPDGFAVYDVGRNALVRFSPDGKFLGQMAAPRQYQEGVMRTDSDAIILAQKVRDPKTDAPIMSIVRLSRTDTASIIAAQIDDEISVNFPGCGITMSLLPIFADPPAWDARNGITAVAEAPLYGVRMYRGTKEFRRVRRRLQPEAASNQYALLAAGEDRDIPMLDGTTCTITPLQIAKGSGWKEVIPAIGAIAIAPDQGLWLRRVDPGRPEPAVDVIDGKGEYVGTLPLHTPWPIGFLPNGNPVSLTEDTLGVSRIIVYKIDKERKAPIPGQPPKKK
jgi:hypothetical protein